MLLALRAELREVFDCFLIGTWPERSRIVCKRSTKGWPNRRCSRLSCVVVK
jgi:hypothetical protein